MSNNKFWALITSNRPHVFSLGQHDDFDKAAAFATEFCERKNTETLKAFEELRAKEPATEVETPNPHELIWILDDGDLRALTGEVHRPYIVAREKREIGVDVPIRHGRVEEPLLVEEERELPQGNGLRDNE